MTIEQNRVTTVLERMIQMVKADEGYAESFSLILEDGLGDMKREDAFGSEGQCDPRGDGRNDNFSMDFVEGVDD